MSARSASSSGTTTGGSARNSLASRMASAHSSRRISASPRAAEYPSLKTRYRTAITRGARSGSSSSDGTWYGIPAPRIFPFARTSRCAMAAGVVKKARAISSVVRPHRVRSVSATCASGASAGDLAGHVDGLVQVLRLDQVKSAQLLLRLGERSIRGEPLAVADGDGGGGCGRLERVPAEDGLGELLPERPVLGHLLRVVAARLPALLVLVDEQQVLHGGVSSLPCSRTGQGRIDSAARQILQPQSSWSSSPARRSGFVTSNTRLSGE